MAQDVPTQRVTPGPEIRISLPAYERAFEAKVRLEAGRCPHCGTLALPPRHRCLGCGAEGDAGLAELPRDATVYTTTTIHTPVPGLATPYTIVIVELGDTGVRLLAQVTGAPPGNVGIGDRGEMVLAPRRRAVGHPRLRLRVLARGGAGGRPMRRVAVIGAGMTNFGEHFELGIKDLVPMAVTEAVDSVDKGFDRADIDAAWFGELTTTDGFPSGIFADSCGLLDVPVTRIENACATGNDAIRNGVYGVASGMLDVVLGGRRRQGPRVVGARHVLGVDGPHARHGVGLPDRRGRARRTSRCT